MCNGDDLILKALFDFKPMKGLEFWSDVKMFGSARWVDRSKGRTLMEAWMNEESSYCGCGSEVKNVSDLAKIANMIMTGAV